MKSKREQIELCGRKKVFLRARPNLQISSRIERGRRVYLVNDPVSLRYFHLEEKQHFALEKMNGRHTLADIQTAFEEQFKPQRVTLDELEELASQFMRNGLAHAELPSMSSRILHLHKRQVTWARWTKLLNIFYLKIPLFHPDRFLTKLLPLGRVLFHPCFVAGVILALVACVGIVLCRWHDFQERLPAWQEFLSWRSLLFLWLAFGCVKILHELGHGLCCKTMGSEVNDTGLALLFFFPTLYCNVTDCWKLPSKTRRMAITAAGIYVEILIAISAVFIWWITDPSSLLHQLSFALILVCSIHTIVFNANPLMRFDGYFLLSDWLEIPNLAQVASSRLKALLMRWFGIEAPAATSYGSSFPLALFGLASLVYRCFVIGGVMYLFYAFMKDQHLQWLGFWSIVSALLMIAALPAYQLIKFVQSLGRLPQMRRRNAWISLGLVATVAFVVLFVPLPMAVSGVALLEVEPSSANRLTIPKPGGILEELYVRDGQKVKQGDILALLKNPALEIKLRRNQAEQSLRIEQKHALANHQKTLQLANVQTETYEEIEHELTALAHLQQLLIAQKSSLTLRAPNDGVVMRLPGWKWKGKWLDEGTQLCMVGDTSSLRAVVLVPSADRQLIAEKKGSGTFFAQHPAGRSRPPIQSGVADPFFSARFLSHGTGVIWPGKVTGVAQVNAESIPAQLSNRIGGDVVSQRDPVTGEERPHEQHFLVSIRLRDVDHRLQAGALGQVRIDAGCATVWWRCRRWLGTTFNWGL